VFTDEWKGYIGLFEDCDFYHFTNNHSKGFKDYNLEVNTNLIENTWKHVKSFSNYILKDKKHLYFIEYIWRKKLFSQFKSPWEEIISLIKIYFPV
jgi:hypothetical protein